jgi:hypothetical protein
MRQDEQNDGETKSIFEFMEAELERHDDDDANDDKVQVSLMCSRSVLGQCDSNTWARLCVYMLDWASWSSYETQRVYKRDFFLTFIGYRFSLNLPTPSPPYTKFSLVALSKRQFPFNS